MTERIHREVTEMPADWLPLLAEAAAKKDQPRGVFMRELIEAGVRSRLKRRIKFTAMRGRGRVKN